MTIIKTASVGILAAAIALLSVPAMAIKYDNGNSANLIGGAANQVPYQTGSGATAFSGAVQTNSVFYSSGQAPTWATAPALSSVTLTGTGAAVYDLTTSSGVNILQGSFLDAGPAQFTNAANAGGFSIFTSSGISMPAGTLLAAGPIQATNAANAGGYSVFTSSGISMAGGTLLVGGAGGLFTATGNQQYSLYATSGVSVGQGVVANFFAGSGAGLTSLPPDANLNGGAAGQIPFQSNANQTQFTSTFTLSGGNLGIGNSNPGTVLDVTGGATIRGQETITSTLTVLGGNLAVTTGKLINGLTVLPSGLSSNYTYGAQFSSTIFVAAGNGAPSAVHFWDMNGAANAKIWEVSSSRSNDTFEVNAIDDGVSALSYGLVIERSGASATNVGIGINNPGSKLDVSGDETVRGQETVTSTLTVLGAGGTSPGASFLPNISSFTATGAITGTFTNTTWACLSSTVSLTLPTNYSKVHIDFNGAMSDGNLAAVVVVGILVDGALIDQETLAKGMTAFTEQVMSNINNVSFTETLTGLSSASHQFCLAGFVSAGTLTIDNTNSVAQMKVYMLP